MELFLSNEQFKAIAGQLDSQPGICSPFFDSSRNLASVQAVPVSPEKIEELRSSGILATLTRTGNVVAFTYSGLDFAYKTALYVPVSPGSGAVVSISETDQGLRVASPPLTGTMLEMVLQYMGDSQVKMIDVETELGLRETGVLFAFIDACRRRLLINLLENEELNQVPAVEKADILAAGKRREANLQWMAPYFLEISGQPSLEQSDLQNLLPRLIQKGMLQEQDGKLIPQPDMLRLAISFLLVESASRIQAAQGTTKDDVQRVDIWALQGRNHSLLSWSMDEAGVTLQGLSPAQWLLMLSEMLDDPGGIFENVEVSQPVQAAESIQPTGNGTKTCPSCSAQVPADKKFCTSCGHKF